MIKSKINAIKKAKEKIFKREGLSNSYFNCEKIIEILEKLDNEQDIDNDDLNYIRFPYYQFEGNIKMIGEWYYDYYCR